jgi:hypothetical protein
MKKYLQTFFKDSLLKSQFKRKNLEILAMILIEIEIRWKKLMNSQEI